MPEVRRAIPTWIAKLDELHSALAVDLREELADARVFAGRRRAVGDVGAVGVAELEGVAGAESVIQLLGLGLSAQWEG
jgi:hypothetical protein